MSSSSVSRNSYWYAAQLKPNGLNIALRNLERQSFRVFVPTELRTIRRGVRFHAEKLPVFPGYIFVAVDPEIGRWRAINSTAGVSRLVSFGAAPVRVAPSLISALMRRYCTEAPEDPIEFGAGEEVQISDGPFTDFLARVEAVSPERRVHLLIDLFGRESRLTVAPEHLRRTG